MKQKVYNDSFSDFLNFYKKLNNIDLEKLDFIHLDFSNSYLQEENIDDIMELFNTMIAESRNVNGRIVKNAINPIELVNKRQSLNDISYRGNSNVEELQRKAVSLIDRIIEKNTDLGNLPEEFIFFISCRLFRPDGDSR